MSLFSIFQKINKRLYGWNLGAIPGLRPFHRYLVEKLKPKGIVPVSVFGKKMFIDSRDSAGGTELMLYGVYGPYATYVAQKIVKPGMVVADIGAHIGYFTILFSESVGEKGKVFAFEPEPLNFELLSRTVEENHMRNVEAVKVALSNKEGMTKLFLDKTNLGNMSLAKENIPKGQGDGSIEVKKTTLDSFMKGRKIDIIKIDVQGAEGLVFEGGRDVLKNVKAVLLEYWPYGLRNCGSDPVSFLRMFKDQGFDIFVIDEGRKEMRPVEPESMPKISSNRPDGKGWCNVLCVRG